MGACLRLQLGPGDLAVLRGCSFFPVRLDRAPGRGGRDSDLGLAAAHIRSSGLVVVLQYCMVADIDSRAVAGNEVVLQEDSS